MRLIAATRNAAKVAELGRLVAGISEVEVAPHDISQKESSERATTLEAIASLKAASSSAIIDRGELVVASDGGLLIPALGERWDPLRTRRFAQGALSDRERADALLALAAGLSGEERWIAWREALAVARDGEVLACWAAESCPGLLAENYDPEVIDAAEGFWVPALWICPEFGGRRLAELSPAERARRRDHWTQLGASLRAFLINL